jgi:hypothetical protein
LLAFRKRAVYIASLLKIVGLFKRNPPSAALRRRRTGFVSHVVRVGTGGFAGLVIHRTGTEKTAPSSLWEYTAAFGALIGGLK